MKDAKKKASFGLVLALMLGMVLSGTANPPNPLDYIAPNCYDGLDNDGESDPFVGDIKDLDDSECVYMPYIHAGWGSGEYDGRGFNPPLQSDIEVYVIEWNKSDVPTNHYQGVKALHEYFGSDVCSDGRVQAALTNFRDNFAIEDYRTGISQHQNECGLSY